MLLPVSLKKIVSGLTGLAVLISSASPSLSQNALVPSVHTVHAAKPAVLCGLKLDPADPFKLAFLLEGDIKRPAESQSGQVFARAEAERLVRYFLVSLTVPEKELWVNLSPLEKDRVVPEHLGKTEMGRDLLLQDFLLKELTASLLNPDSATGREFWRRLYGLAYEKFGTTDLPLDSFNKVWIVPSEAVVVEGGTRAGLPSAYIERARLKVMLESDYDAMKAQGAIEGEERRESSAPQQMARQVLKELIVPMLDEEINEGAPSPLFDRSTTP